MFRNYPDDPLAARAVFRVAVNSEWLFDFDKSVRHYELFYEEFEGPTPEELEQLNFAIEENREESLLQAAQMNEYLQRYEDAARRFEEFVETYPESEFSADTLWAAADAWEKAGEDDEMIRVLDAYIDEYGGDREHGERIIRGHSRVAKLHEDQGRRDDADDRFETIVELVDEWREADEELPPGEERIRELAAESRFILVERNFEEWDDITIEGTLAQQERRLEEKLDGVEQLQDEYEEVLEYRNLDWNLAAYYRIANLLHRTAEALYEVPNPFEEGSEEYWVYQDTLDDIAFPLEDTALERYKETIERARENEIANEWTEETLESLHEFEPDNYPFYEEERQPRPQLVEEGGPMLTYELYEELQERQDWRDEDPEDEVDALQSDGDETDDQGEDDES